MTGQELVEVTDSETGEPFNTVNVTVEVTPSDDTEHYYVAFPQSDVVADNGGDYGYAFALVLSMEQYEGISSWFAPAFFRRARRPSRPSTTASPFCPGRSARYWSSA